MNKSKARSEYIYAKLALFFIIVSSIYTTIASAARITSSFLYTVIVPQLAMAYVRYYFSGLAAFLIVTLFIVFPVVTNIICFYLSKEQWQWLIIPTGMMLADTIVLAEFIINSVGLSIVVIVDMLIEIALLVVLFKGTKAGKWLNNHYDLDDEDEDFGFRLYQYDTSLAKVNKTNRKMYYMIAIIVSAGLYILATFSLGLLLTYTSLNLNTSILIYGIMILLIAGIFILSTKKMQPYLEADQYQYYLHEGQIHKAYGYNFESSEVLENLEIDKRNQSEFIGNYHKNGKIKKIIIPNCYKDIEDIL